MATGPEAPDHWGVPAVVRETRAHWEHAWAVVVEAARQNLGRWFAGRFSAGSGAWLLKAGSERPGTGGRQPVLTTRDLEELVELVRMHLEAPAAGLLRQDWRMPAEYASAWRGLGILAPDVDVSEIVRDPMVAGQLFRVLKSGATLADMRRLAAQHPMPRHVQLAVETAEQQAGRWIVAFGQKLADRAQTLAITTNRELAQRTIRRYVSGELPVTKRSEQAHATLTVDERAALETPKIVSGWKALAGELYHGFKDTDATRDWLRVGWTETQSAYQSGRVLAMAEQGPKQLLYREPSPKACRHCLALYLGPDGRPRLFTVAEVLRNGEDNGGMNVGRKASKMGGPGGWLAVMGTTHPWCACRWQVYVAGAFDRQAQIIAEGLARRIPPHGEGT